ncbi:MAG: tetratricopeptide repeat protein [Candidatus Auribacterota bacterium]|nr:tetratricopeptide repeat protein [Candidatus Auribacterota bacterium]
MRIAYQRERCYGPSRYDLAYGMDQYNYDRLAFSLAHNNDFFPGVIYSLPGYPIFLYLVYLLLGRSLDLVWLLQAGMGTISCGLTYLIARKIIGDRAGWLAGLIMVFYGPVIFYESLLVPTTLALLISLLSLTWWIYLPGEKSLSAWLIGGVLLGLSSLFSAANIIFGLLLVCIYIPRVKPKLPRRRWKIVGVGAGILVVIIPFVLRNSRPAGGSVALTAHSGINFFIGNNPEANGGFLTPEFLTPSATGIIRDSHREAESRSGRELDPAEGSRFWWREGIRFFFVSPGGAIKLWLNKLSLTISPREYLDVRGEALQPFRFYGLAFISFGWLAPFALAGIVLSARREKSKHSGDRELHAHNGSSVSGTTRGRPEDRRYEILYLYLGAHIFAILIFYFQARARIMIVPILAVAAAGTIRLIYKYLRQKQYKRVVFSGFLIMAVFLLVKAQPVFEMRSETNLLLDRAQQNLVADKLPAARIKINRSLEINPELGGAYFLLGDIRSREGDNQEALDYFRRESEIDPSNPGPLLRVCRISNIMENYSDAEAAARKVLKIDPLSWKAYSLLADSYYYRGDKKNELYNSRQAVKLNPNSLKDHSNLARYYAREGDPGMAEYHGKHLKRMNVERRTFNSERRTMISEISGFKK